MVFKFHSNFEFHHELNISKDMVVPISILILILIFIATCPCILHGRFFMCSVTF